MLNALHSRSIGKRYKFPRKYVTRSNVMAKLSSWKNRRRIAGIKRAIPKFRAAAKRAKSRVRVRNARRTTSSRRYKGFVGFKNWPMPKYNKGYAYTFRRR